MVQMTSEERRVTGRGQRSNCLPSEADTSADEATVEASVTKLLRQSVYAAVGAVWLGETDQSARPDCPRPFCRAFFVCTPDTREFRCTCRGSTALDSKTGRV